MKKVKAKCLKTYPDEDDMDRYVQGEIEPCEVKIFHRGRIYFVCPEYYNPEYFEIIDK